MNRPYQICTFCVMDTSEPDIRFDDNGRCNHCTNMEVRLMAEKPEPDAEFLNKKISEIKKQGKGKKYDCLVGISGGVDSTYTALLAKNFGLRPLLFHVDNGWATRDAVHNINAIVKYTAFDYVSKVLDWDEFRDLQVAYLKASVIDVETLTDHAVFASTLQIAAKHNIHTILIGENTATEAILPPSWHYSNKLTDSVNIKDIYRKFTGKKLKQLPILSYEKYLFYTKARKVDLFRILNYVPFNKDEVKKQIIEKIGWKDYGGKHYESVFTRFYQGYILPKKFGIDKRRAHLSTLIVSGQITRNEALEQLQKPPLPEEVLTQDKEYVPKKLGLTKAEFEDILELPVKKHEDYKTDEYKRGNLGKLKRFFKKN